MTKPIIGIGADLAVKEGQRDRAFAYITYTEALRRAGAVVVIIPPQPENAAAVIASLDGILLAGGDDCDPAVYGQERHQACETMDPRRQAAIVRQARTSTLRRLERTDVRRRLEALAV